MIFFNVAEARQQLLNEGSVYTLRPKMRRTGADIAVCGSYYKWEKIADVMISFVKEVGEIKELREYVKDSGFVEVGAWWRAAKGSRFLFRVDVR